jgi:hypothetical protein
MPSGGPGMRAYAQNRAVVLPLVVLKCLILISFGTRVSPTEIPCSVVASGGGNRVVFVSSNGASVSGCEIFSTNLVLLVLVDTSSAPGPGNVTAVPVHLRNIRGQLSSVTVRLASGASSNPSATKNPTSIEVVVENCTLTGAVDAFVVDTHNATGLSEVNLTVRDSTILRATRGAVSVYRSALALNVAGPAESASMSVRISVERSTIEVVGPSVATRCGNDTVPEDYRNVPSKSVPVLCPVFAASVLLAPPDTPTTVSAASIYVLNATKVGIVSRDSNVTVNSSSGSDTYAASVVRTALVGPSLALSSVSIEVNASVVFSIAKGGVAASGSLVLANRIAGSVVSLEDAAVRVTGAQSRITGQDRDGRAPAAALGLSLFGREATILRGCTTSFDVSNSGVWADGGPLVVASGVTQYSWGSSSSNSNNITLQFNMCNVAAAGNGGNAAVASTGIALYGSGNCSSDNDNITLLVNVSNVTVRGSGTYAAVSATGLAFFSSSSSSIDSTNVILQVEGCNATATSSGNYAAVSSAGIAQYGGGSFSCNDGKVTLRVNNSVVTATGSGTYSAVTSTGIALFSTSGGGSGSSLSNSITALVSGSSLKASGAGNYAVVSSSGIALYSGSSSIINNTINVSAYRCNLMATVTGNSASVSSTGIASYSQWSRTTNFTSNSVKLVVDWCNVMATGS